MPTAVRKPILLLSYLLMIPLAGCYSGPNAWTRQAQLQTRQMWQQNQALAQQRDALAMEKQAAEQQAAQLAAELQTANGRLANLNQERAQLQDRYVSLLNEAKNPLSAETTRKFEELSRKYKEFDFDPVTGVSKFHSDVLFASGSSDIKSTATNLLQEFAGLMNRDDARMFHILVVGHTDDKPIKKSATAAKHPTNWHLSTNRANSVVLSLAQHGIKESRMGSAGYSMFQPVNPNTDDSARQRNRRVEIFVLAPEANVAGWDPNTSLN